MKKIDVDKLQEKVLREIEELFSRYEKISLFNTRKILQAFKNNKVSDYHFHSASGYGYADLGRDNLDQIYAEIFQADKGLVRSQFVSGTHALSTALFGMLRPGDEMLAVTGAPYDTLQTVIGAKIRQKGSLCAHGVVYQELEFAKGQELDYKKIKASVNRKTKLVHIQRSRGYAARKSLSVAEIGRICESVKSVNKSCICFVDNCYGEFVDKIEPTQVGADVLAGSLIKNPGGGLAPSGGYIVGRADLLEEISFHYTAPGLGSGMGSAGGDVQRFLYQGLFLAPHVTLQALKTAIYAAALFSQLGYQVSPLPEEIRQDIIQSIELTSAEALIAFCQAIQTNSPVDSYVLPVPGKMPGYQDEVVMAAGTFIQGASIELSADGPLRPPYTVYLQGGLTFEHGILALTDCVKNILST